MGDTSNENIYQIVTVEKTTAPVGLMGDNWFRYVIQKGNLTNSIMEGKITSSLKTVTQNAADVVEPINLRNVKGKRK